MKKKIQITAAEILCRDHTTVVHKKLLNKSLRIEAVGYSKLGKS